jgi:hypothetical protein
MRVLSTAKRDASVTTIFISHSSKDSQYAAGHLKSLLEMEGFSVWCSSVDMPVGVEWEEQIRKALACSDWFVVVMSPEAARSDWVRAETHWALEHRSGRVIPLMLQTCEPTAIHLKLARLHYLDSRTDPKRAMSTLVSILRGECIDSAPLEEETGGVTILLSHRCGMRASFTMSSDSDGQPEDRTVDINGHCVIGRARDVDFRVTTPSVSRRHARLSVIIEDETKRLEVTDLESANGTFVNGRRITAAHRLAVGDTIEVGTICFRVKQLS